MSSQIKGISLWDSNCLHNKYFYNTVGKFLQKEAACRKENYFEIDLNKLLNIEKNGFKNINIINLYKFIKSLQRGFYL